MAIETEKLKLLLIQATWQFGDEAFNRVIKDADDKLVGVAHLSSPMHWTEWEPETVYVKGDVVRYPNLKSHQYAACLVGGTSDIEDNIPENNITGSIIDDNTVKWEVCSLTESDPNGGTIRIWLAGTYYRRGTAVRYGDALYRAKIDHEASTTFAADEDKWQEIYAPIRFWKPNTYYYLDDTAIYEDIIYKCIEAHTSVANFESDSSATPPVVGDEDKWEIIGGAGGAKDWETNKKYQYGQLVLVNGILYRCNTKHKSNATAFQNDIVNWDLVDAQIHDWQTAQYYVAGTLVAYNNIIYKCLTSHTSSANFETDISNWTLYHNHIIIWDRNKSYYQGQIILYENRLYKCNTTHVSPNEITESGITRDATFLDDISNFDVIYASLAVWDKNTVYKIGDTILYNNEPFRCVKNHTSGSTSTSTIFDDITNDSNNCWERIGQKNPYITNWASNTNYDANQLVLYNGTLYRCNTLHTSTSTFDSTKWDFVYANIQEWVTNIPYKLHSMVIYNDRIYLCTTAHTSTTFSADRLNWLEIGGAGGTLADWESDAVYTKDTPILYNGIIYRSNVTHSSSSTFGADAAKWDIVYSSISTWTTNKYYPVNMLVSYNNLVYKCVTAHTSSAAFNTDIANWILYNNSITSWASSIAYKIGQIVLYDGVVYKCNTNHVSVSPFDVTKWDLVYANIRQYANNTIYKVGSEVIYNKDMYRCIESHTSNTDDISYYDAYINTDYFLRVEYNSSLPKEFVVDLGAVKDIRHYSIEFASNQMSVTNMDILISEDGINYNLLYNRTTSLEVYTPVSEFCVERARYVKIVVKSCQKWGTDSTVRFCYLHNLRIGIVNPYWERIGNYNIQILEWQSNKIYDTNEIVKYQSGIYRCLQTHSDSIWDTNKWEQIGGTIVTKQQIDNLFI